MNRPALYAILILALATTAHAQTVAVSDLPNGTYILTVSASGATVSPATLATVGKVPVPPVTPGPIPPVDPTTLSTAITAAANAVIGDSKRAETAGALALVYRQGADFLADGTLKTPEQAIKWAELGSNIALRQQGSATAWQPVRDAIGSELDALARKGQLANAAQYGVAFGQVADGLSASAGDSAAFDFAKLLELLIKLLPIILALFGV